jgi:hypothetical protein
MTVAAAHEGRGDPSRRANASACAHQP